jgi:hypothetical protein
MARPAGPGDLPEGDRAGTIRIRFLPAIMIAMKNIRAGLARSGSGFRTTGFTAHMTFSVAL